MNKKQKTKKYFDSGYDKAQLGNYKEAISDFNKAIELYKKFDKTEEIEQNLAESYNNRGIAKKYLGKYKEAISDYDEAIKVNQKLFLVYYNRGLAKENLYKYEEAILDFNKAIKINPKFVYAYNNRGLTKANLGKYKEATQDYDKAIEINPKLAEVYNNRGIAKNSLDKPEEAILDYDKAIELKSDFVEAYHSRGLAKYKLGKYEEVILDYIKAIEINPNYLRAYYNRGNYYIKLDNYKKAIADLYELIKYSKQKPNKTLYQYAPINNEKLLALINNELYFADYNKLNDPFECYFMERSWINNCLEKEKITTRILALTYDNESHSMYSHYAKSHTGFCIECEIDFNEIYNNNKISYGEVQYKTKNKIENLYDLYMLKTPEWKYEKEYRLVRFDNKEFIPCTIKSITFALKCNKEHKKIVYNLMKNKKDIKFYEAKKKYKENSLERNKMTEEQIKELKIDEKNLYKLMLKHKFES